MRQTAATYQIHTCGRLPHRILAFGVCACVCDLQFVAQIRDASDIATFRQTCLEVFDILVDSGVLKGPSQLQMSEQVEVVRALCLHQLVLKSKAEIDQLRNWLKTLGVFRAIESHVAVFESVFTAKEPLTPKYYNSVVCTAEYLTFFCSFTQVSLHG